MVNKVMLIGRLGADPEIKQTKKGESFANLSLATNKKYKDKRRTMGKKLHGTKLLCGIQDLQTICKSMQRLVLNYMLKVN